MLIASPVTSWTIDNNLYYHSAGGNFMYWKGNNLNWSDWKSRCNCDQHSYNENRQFVSPGSNSHLLQTSPCIDHGIGFGLSQDFDGKAILSNPDIGALEFGGKPTPPKNPRILQYSGVNNNSIIHCENTNLLRAEEIYCPIYPTQNQNIWLSGLAKRDSEKKAVINKDENTNNVPIEITFGKF
jgi:hypothetical protein